LRTLADDPPQDRVDQPGVAHGTPVGSHQPDGEINRRVIRDVEPQNLCDPKKESYF
jgi:hypothetical protein